MNAPVSAVKNIPSITFYDRFRAWAQNHPRIPRFLRIGSEQLCRLDEVKSLGCWELKDSICSTVWAHGRGRADRIGSLGSTQSWLLSQKGSWPSQGRPAASWACRGCPESWEASPRPWWCVKILNRDWSEEESRNTNLTRFPSYSNHSGSICSAWGLTEPAPLLWMICSLASKESSSP